MQSTLIIIVALCVLAEYDYVRFGRKQNAADAPAVDVEPYFDYTPPRAFEVPFNESVHLRCRVRHQCRLKVAWVRLNDGALLSINEQRVTTSPRIQISHAVLDNGNDWILSIRRAKQSDVGYYQCQLSTDPIQRYSIFLKVLDLNECLVENGGCAQICKNEPGSYKCECASGFALCSDGRNCEDLNECLVENGGCEHLCKNEPGSHKCECSSGFALSSDGRSCELE